MGYYIHCIRIQRSVESIRNIKINVMELKAIEIGAGTNFSNKVYSNTIFMCEKIIAATYINNKDGIFKMTVPNSRSFQKVADKRITIVECF